MSGRGIGLKGMIASVFERHPVGCCLCPVLVGRRFGDIDIGLSMVTAAKARHASCSFILEKLAEMPRKRRADVWRPTPRGDKP